MGADARSICQRVDPQAHAINRSYYFPNLSLDAVLNALACDKAGIPPEKRVRCTRAFQMR